MLDGYPIPPCSDCPPTGPVEAWFAGMLGFWLLYFTVLLVLPRKWTKAIFEVMFPFLPPPPEK